MSITGGVKLNGAPVIEKYHSISGKLSDNTNINVNDGNIHFFSTSESANATPNIRGDASTSLNSVMSIGETMTVTVFTPSSGSGYYASVTIDGSAPFFGPHWLNDGEPSTAAANATFQIYTYTIFKTANATFVCLANRSIFES